MRNSYYNLIVLFRGSNVKAVLDERFQRVKNTIECALMGEMCLKIKLMIQALSPLALLTIAKSFSFKTLSETGEKLCGKAFLKENVVLLCVLLFCLFWILISIFFFISFAAFRWTDKKSGYEITSIEEKEDASLNFFVTLILPLLIDDISTIQGAITFALIILLLSMLLYQTKLFYANPVLAILGYHIYSFQFKHNSEYGNCICIGVCHGRIGGKDAIEYKTISGNVLYIGEMKK